MKHLLSFALALCTSALLAQVPNSFNYQSIVRDGFGALVGSQQLGVKVSIVKDSLGGNVQYSETHSPTTNSNGLFSIQIGEGNATTGVFDSIGWESGGLYYQVEVDMQGGTNYALNSFQPFSSVAYAKVAERALNVDDADADPTNELQQISLSGDTLSLSNGGSVVMPNSASNLFPTNNFDGNYLNNHGLLSIPAGDTLEWIVPLGVQEIQLILFGSRGGSSGQICVSSNCAWPCTNGNGGSGMDITFKFQVTSGDTVLVVTGENGEDLPNRSSSGPGGGAVASITGNNGSESFIFINSQLLVYTVGGTGGISGRKDSGAQPSCGSTGQTGNVYLYGDATTGIHVQTLNSFNYGLAPLGLIDIQWGYNLAIRGLTGSANTYIAY